MLKKLSHDRRIIRANVELERRRVPYVYKYEIKEVAHLLEVDTRVLQEMIREKLEEYKNMIDSGS